MNNMTFLYEQNGFKVSKLSVMGLIFFIVENKTTGKRYIRKSQSVVQSIISGCFSGPK